MISFGFFSGALRKKRLAKMETMNKVNEMNQALSHLLGKIMDGIHYPSENVSSSKSKSEMEENEMRRELNVCLQCIKDLETNCLMEGSKEMGKDANSIRREIEQLEMELEEKNELIDKVSKMFSARN